MIRTLPLLRPVFGDLPATFARWDALYRQRRALATLDDSALADIGLSRHAAEAESARPFWDAAGTGRI